MNFRIDMLVYLGFVLILLFANILLSVKELICWRKVLNDHIAYDRHDEKIFREDSLIIGGIRQEPAYLVVGVPTVYRDFNNSKALYLSKTLKSMIKPLSKYEKSLIQFLILLADRDEDKRRNLYEEILIEFPAELQNGLINVIAIPERYYLKLVDLPTTFGDTPQRMYWRSKQALDYAFMFNYAHKLCINYMQIEDDVIASKDYFKIIVEQLRQNRKEHSGNKLPRDEKNFESQSNFLLRVHEFYHMGFIGRVFESSYLPFLSSYIRVVYDQIPVDLIYPHAITFSLGEKKQHKDLFEHIGMQSSSKGT